MDLNSIKPGLRVKTGILGDTKGMLIHEKHLAVRKPDQAGTISRWVPGHGGDVWFVQHDDSEEIGAYSYDEFEAIP
jgi:hypothetical protein